MSPSGVKRTGGRLQAGAQIVIDLQSHRDPLLEFLELELRGFLERRPAARLRHVALYSCPWSGWVSLCLDSKERIDQNCPDFEHVEVALYEAPDWSSEYETSDMPEVSVADGLVRVIAVDSEGDEAYNEVFFSFLCDVLAAATGRGVLRELTRSGLRLGVQMLDSELNRTWRPAAI